MVQLLSKTTFCCQTNLKDRVAVDEAFGRWLHAGFQASDKSMLLYQYLKCVVGKGMIRENCKMWLKCLPDVTGVELNGIHIFFLIMSRCYQFGSKR